MTCPFCGRGDLGTFECSEPYPMAYIYCKDCNAEGPTGATLRQALEKWNVRKPGKLSKMNGPITNILR